MVLFKIKMSYNGCWLKVPQCRLLTKDDIDKYIDSVALCGFISEMDKRQEKKRREGFYHSSLQSIISH